MPPIILYYAIPAFVLLLSLEAWLAYRENRHRYESHDTFASLGLGIGNVLTGLITKALIFGLFMLLYQYRIFSPDSGKWWFWVLLFLADDFSYYWFHRISHSVNYFWASHVVHHSSKHYNLAAALRQTWTGNLSGTFIFWAWMPLIGFHPIWVLFMQQLSLIYQFWIHTEWIRQMPAPIEFFFNTPSHHRVHHGSDLKYLDRNHGGILIIWDRLFGTFTPEAERPVYGLRENIESFNPAVVAFSTWGSLFRKAIESKSLYQGIRYFLMPPGWSHDNRTKTTAELRKENSVHANT